MLNRYHQTEQLQPPSGFRIEVRYSHESEVKEEDCTVEVIETLEHHELCDLTKQDYSDLPQHWKYLEYTAYTPPLVGVNKIIIVEKYQNVAIGYCPIKKRRPVILYREKYESFESLKLGDVFEVVLGKMHIYVKRPTLIFTDLYVSSVCDALSIIETAVIMRNLKIRDFTFEVKQIEVIDGLEVIFTDFGDIVIPEEISEVCSFTGLKNMKEVFVVCSVKYQLVEITENRYACWMLLRDFTVYAQETIYAKCYYEQYEVMPKSVFK